MRGLMSVQRVAAALLPMDGVTGKPAERGRVKIAIRDGGAWGKKEDGYVIIWDNGQEERVVSLDSPWFQPEEIHLDIRALREKRLPSVHVWLKPGRDYPWPSEIVLKEERKKPCETIRIPMEASLGLVKLEGAYPMDSMYPEEIILRASPSVELEGRCLMIRGGGRKHQEFFRIWEPRNRSLGLYVLEEPLQGVYSVYDAEIFLVLELRADEQGYCQIPVAEADEE